MAKISCAINYECTKIFRLSHSNANTLYYNDYNWKEKSLRDYNFPEINEKYYEK